jgi:hypothetical protein
VAYQDLLNAVARVVGGTQPSTGQSSVGTDAEGFNRQPYWFSGVDTGDSTGVTGLVGCFSLPMSSLDATPVGMVLPGPWKPEQPFPTQGRKFLEDQVHVRVMTGHDAIGAQMAMLVNFRDLVETAFNQHMQLFGTAGVLAAKCESGDFVEVDLGGTTYLAVEFYVNVQRGLSVAYAG